MAEQAENTRHHLDGMAALLEQNGQMKFWLGLIEGLELICTAIHQRLPVSVRDQVNDNDGVTGGTKHEELLLNVAFAKLA